MGIWTVVLIAAVCAALSAAVGAMKDHRVGRTPKERAHEADVNTWFDLTCAFLFFASCIIAVIGILLGLLAMMLDAQL